MDILDSIRDLRAQLGVKRTHMEVLRDVLQNELGRSTKPAFPVLLSDADREHLADNLARVEGFLASDDGRDACALLVAAFREYVDAVDDGE